MMQLTLKAESSFEMTFIHIWREVTGGGTPKAYLCWLSAQWELFTMDNPDNENYYLEYCSPQEARQYLRQDFRFWLRARFVH